MNETGSVIYPLYNSEYLSTIIQSAIGALGKFLFEAYPFWQNQLFFFPLTLIEVVIEPFTICYFYS